jgi:hypothetical protein
MTIPGHDLYFNPPDGDWMNPDTKDGGCNIHATDRAGCPGCEKGNEHLNFDSLHIADRDDKTRATIMALCIETWSGYKVDALADLTPREVLHADLLVGEKLPNVDGSVPLACLVVLLANELRLQRMANLDTIAVLELLRKSNEVWTPPTDTGQHPWRGATTTAGEFMNTSATGPFSGNEPTDEELARDWDGAFRVAPEGEPAGVA